MSKPDKAKDKAETNETSSITGNKTLVIAIAAIAIIAIAAIAAIMLMPAPAGTSTSSTSTPSVPPAPSLPLTPPVSGTGTGAAVVSGDSVSVYYTGMLNNGTVFDSNVNAAPLTFTVGAHQVIPGFENALTGMKAGETKTVNISVDQAYGPYHPEYIHVLNRTGILATMNLTEGTYLRYRNPATNATSAVLILNVTPETVTVDGNSPLAGEPLIFTIQLVSVNKNGGGNPSTGS